MESESNNVQRYNVRLNENEILRGLISPAIDPEKKNVTLIILKRKSNPANEDDDFGNYDVDAAHDTVNNSIKDEDAMIAIIKKALKIEVAAADIKKC